MNLKYNLLISLWTALFLFSGAFPAAIIETLFADEEQRTTEYRVVVKIIGDEWRVVLDGDDTKSDVTLRRGDRIRWVVEGSDASFHFPDARIFGQETREVKAGNPLVLAVTPNSPKGTFAYAVFIHESMTYARGQSPPRIIIR
jgi:hypothetical protein